MAKEPQVITAKIHGRIVLGKLYHGEPTAKTFANRKQAETAAVRFGGWVMGRWPFYVCLDTVSASEMEG
jgi:hypothetical protein